MKTGNRDAGAKALGGRLEYPSSTIELSNHRDYTPLVVAGVRLMVVTRTIVIVLVAISLVVLPGTLLVSQSSSAEMSMADDTHMPCCPPSTIQGAFKSNICALKCIALYGAIMPTMTTALLLQVGGSALLFSRDTLRGIIRTPPTHPPPA